MRGFKINDAAVSDVHCNFIVNTGKATASDYKKLMDLIIDRAKTELNIDLEPEIILLGFD